MYLTKKNKNYFILDLEADSLTPTIIWCVCLLSLETGEEFTFLNQSGFNDWIEKQDDPVFVGHNAISYDIPVLNRLWDTKINLYTQVVDSLVLSYLYNPALEGGHSLEAYGRRLKLSKGDYSDWTRLTDEMVSYCRNDVRLTSKVYEALTKKMLRLGYSEFSAEIEHKIRVIIDRQKDNGCWFDLERGQDFSRYLRSEQSRLAEIVLKLFPPRRTKIERYRFKRTKDGSPFIQYEKHRAKYAEVIRSEIDGEEVYDCYDFISFNLGSYKQRVERLLDLGWEPVSFTKKGNPKVDEDALVDFAKISGREEIKALAEYLVVSARLTTLSGNPKTESIGWLGFAEKDSRIHGQIFSCGAASRRMTHNNPNTANAPSAKKAKYGKEMRSLWGVEPGKGLSMVGYDAKGLETECFKHWLDNPDANRILDGDIHTDNAKALSELIGRPIDREWGAKTSWYAWMFGCYPPKLSLILKCSKEHSEQIFEDMYPNRIPGLKKFIKSIQTEWKENKGRLVCIDGGMVVCPSMSSALNYKIQPTGAVVMKLTSIVLDEEAKKDKMWFRKLLDVHDEGQLECKTEEADRLGSLAVASISQAATRLNFRVPLTGTYHVGTSWDQTH